MSNAKAALKAAKSALDAQDFAQAATQAQKALDADPDNYFGHVFLGRSLEKQDKAQHAVDAYTAASKLKPEDELAWKGLCNAYESLGSQGVDGHISASLELAKVFADKNDLHQCQTVMDQSVAFAKENGTRPQYKMALENIIPSSPIFDFLEGRLPSPAFTYITLADILESDEKEKINKEIGERRTRLGAKLSQVTTDVTREVFAKSNLEKLYSEIINWSTNDDTRREYEERLFQRAYDHLLTLAPAHKASKRHQVLKMARDMVIIKHAYLPAWQLDLEWQDVEDLADLDAGVLREFIAYFPESGLSRVLQGYLGESSPEKEAKHQEHGELVDHDAEEPPKRPLLSSEERLLLLVDGIEESKHSALAHRILSDHYLQIEEYESCVEIARQSLSLLQNESRKSGLHFQRTRDATSLSLATSLVYYQSPKNHPEAKTIFEEILDRKPNSTAALLGSGLILEEQMEFEEASAFLDRALERDPENVRIGTEAAWCKALTGDKSTGLERLESYLESLNKAGLRELKALTLYRIGICLWELRSDRSSRKDRKGAYAQFLASLKANPDFAPTYTSLGEYYADYAKDKRRARQCFQKAFDLSSSEVLAAERLARAFADEGDWDIVEIIAQRVIDSGIVRPSPGSKKKGISWPFAAMGVVQINKQEYPQSVVSFQSALRISPLDYYAWVGLGESYHSSGRYVAARKTLEHAQSIAQADSTENQDQAWFAQYMLSNVLRELGDYDDALKGYKAVLDLRPADIGVSSALLQTLIERAGHSLDTGFFGLAADSAVQAISEAEAMNEEGKNTFNFWKALGDTSTLFASIPGQIERAPLNQIRSILGSRQTSKRYLGSSFDGITWENLESALEGAKHSAPKTLEAVLYCAVLAYEEAIRVSSHDRHAQAIAWYNLGWVEHKTSIYLQKAQNMATSKIIKKTAKASVRCFKGAIELEAGNADFWNALGVVTTCLNPRVSQHSLVRSLHLNARSARTWTNLGALYLIQNDQELAHEAFARAQSTDPDYAQAWVGEGLIALLLGDAHEALSHFTHAAEISDASLVTAKAHYVFSAFDNFLSSPDMPVDVARTVRPIFSLQQLQDQVIRTYCFDHLISLLQERAGDHSAAISNLTRVCEEAEAIFEETEHAEDLGRFAVAKSDLARNYVALREFASALEHAEIALDLTAEAESSGLDAEGRLKIRLSAHLTSGLAKYYLGEMEEALDAFRTALQESNNDPDVVCLLAQVLWVKGNEDEKGMAKDQLFECIENHPGHPQATFLIGAISAIEDDKDTHDAVAADLQAMRTNDQITSRQKGTLQYLISTLTALKANQYGNEEENIAEARASIMLSPANPDSWSNLVDASGDQFAAEMALKTATKSVPPSGDLGVEKLSKAFARVPTRSDAQRAISVFPWGEDGWRSLISCVE